MNGPSCKRLIASVDLVSKFCLKRNVFDKKDFDCNNNAIYPMSICLLIQFFTFSYNKDIRATNTYYNFRTKRTTMTFLTQICPKMNFGVGNSKI